MITGATGFLGRGLVKRLLEDDEFDRICIYSRGEYAQAMMRSQLSDDIWGTRNTRLRWFIGDVRDRDRLERAMEGVWGVIHAAALKRIEVGAMNPDEMVKTNVLGSINVIEAARRQNVSRLLLVSSDKAFEPISPYGQTKALAESLFMTANTLFPRGARTAVVRYGNVWNSTGSVLPTWRAIMACGDAVPVTDPVCTRFFMRLEEAVALVLDTLRDMQGGEVKVPELPAYCVADLAQALDAKMRVTGLREWEKRHESMADGVRSDLARRMSVAELRSELLRG